MNAQQGVEMIRARQEVEKKFLEALQGIQSEIGGLTVYQAAIMAVKVLGEDEAGRFADEITRLL